MGLTTSGTPTPALVEGVPDEFLNCGEHSREYVRVERFPFWHGLCNKDTTAVDGEYLGEGRVLLLDEQGPVNLWLEGLRDYMKRMGGVGRGRAGERLDVPASRELPELLGRSTRDLARERGPEYEREVVHRDDMVIWSTS